MVFFAEDAEKVLAKNGARAILVRIETSPEDLKGMLDAAGILTARGGMTSHAAVVARGMGKCCVSGAGELQIDYKARTIQVNGFTVKEGDWISLNGSTGEVYLGQVATKAADLSGDFGKLMELAGKYSVMKVRANADTPKDAAQAFAFGAEGIGLCRTRGAGQAAADSARRLRGAVQGHERIPRDGPPARSPSARVRAPR